MRLTTKELEQMKSVDIGAVAPESLPDVSGMAFDTSLPREERIALFLQAVDNPYCFCVGGIGVKIEFAESGPSLAGHADRLSAPAKKRAVTSVMARCYFETNCPEAEASLLSRPGRGII